MCALGRNQIELRQQRKDPTDMKSGKLTDIQRTLERVCCQILVLVLRRIGVVTSWSGIRNCQYDKKIYS